MHLTTPRLTLVLQSMQDIRALIASLPSGVREQLSPVWLEQVATATEATPWVHGFSLQDRATGHTIGSAGFKGPPSPAGLVEIAYQVHPDHQGQGYAFSDDRVRTVCAHTLPEHNASAQVLTKCGFTHLGEVIDPEDGLVWRWEKTPTEA